MSRLQICLCMLLHLHGNQSLQSLLSWLPVQYSIYGILPHHRQYNSKLIESKSDATVFNSFDIFTTHTIHRYFKLELISTLSALTSYFRDSSIFLGPHLRLVSQRAECSADPATLSTSQLSKNPPNHLKHLLPLYFLNSTPEKFPAHYTSCAHKNVDSLLVWFPCQPSGGTVAFQSLISQCRTPRC